MDLENQTPFVETPIMGNKIQVIINENNFLKNQLVEMKAAIKNMQYELKNLKLENNELKTQILTNESKENLTINETVEQYCTDEDELARETDWILCKSKKRKAKLPPVQPSTSNNPPKQQKQQNLQHLDEQQSNQQLSNPQNVKNQPQNPGNQIQQDNQQETQFTQKRPPPINIASISSYTELKNIMEKTKIENYKVIALNNNVWKVNTFDSDGYRALSSTLNEENIQWHTYENKIGRLYRVMVRGLHHTCLKDDIINDLKSQGFNPTDAVNIIKKETTVTDNVATNIRRGLPLFMITFSNSDCIDKIYKINNIVNMKVKVEAVKRTSARIPQCKRCQGFNHTKQYCQRDPRCVKCAGKHLTNECTKSTQINPICANCQGNHPASYRGCEVAKELQKIRNKNRAQNIANRPLPEIYIQPLSQQMEPQPQVQLQECQNQPQQQRNVQLPQQPQPQIQIKERQNQPQQQRNFQLPPQQCNTQNNTFAQVVSNQKIQNQPQQQDNTRTPSHQQKVRKANFSHITRNQNQFQQNSNNTDILNQILQNLEKINQRLNNQDLINLKIFNSINAIELRTKRYSFNQNEIYTSLSNMEQ